jgi:hypothetical protein
VIDQRVLMLSKAVSEHRRFAFQVRQHMDEPSCVYPVDCVWHEHTSPMCTGQAVTEWKARQGIQEGQVVREAFNHICDNDVDKTTQ